MGDRKHPMRDVIGVACRFLTKCYFVVSYTSYDSHFAEVFYSQKLFCKTIHNRGPQPQAGTRPWPIWNWATQVVGEQTSVRSPTCASSGQACKAPFAWAAHVHTHPLLMQTMPPPPLCHCRCWSAEPESWALLINNFGLKIIKASTSPKNVCCSWSTVHPFWSFTIK